MLARWGCSAFHYMAWRKGGRLLRWEVLGGFTAGSMRPLCCQNTVTSPVGSCQRRWRCLALRAVAFHTLCTAEKRGEQVRLGVSVLVASRCWWHNCRCLVPSGELVRPLVLGVVARRSRVGAVLWLPACWGSWVPSEGCQGGDGSSSLPPGEGFQGKDKGLGPEI